MAMNASRTDSREMARSAGSPHAAGSSCPAPAGSRSPPVVDHRDGAHRSRRGQRPSAGPVVNGPSTCRGTRWWRSGRAMGVPRLDPRRSPAPSRRAASCPGRHLRPRGSSQHPVTVTDELAPIRLERFVPGCHRRGGRAHDRNLPAPALIGAGPARLASTDTPPDAFSVETTNSIVALPTSSRLRGVSGGRRTAQGGPHCNGRTTRRRRTCRPSSVRPSRLGSPSL